MSIPLITQAEFSKFKGVMRQVHDTFEQKVIVWKKLKSQLNRYGEDNIPNGYTDINLEVQLNYNYLRSWPITMKTETGDLDRQSVQVLINKEWLGEKGYLNGNGLLDYDISNDHFLINGLRYIPMGDTLASQSNTDDILFTMILKIDDTATSQKR